MALLLGKVVESICNRVMEVGECVLYGLGGWWQRRKQLFVWVGCCWILVLHCLVTSLPTLIV